MRQKCTIMKQNLIYMQCAIGRFAFHASSDAIDLAEGMKLKRGPKSNATGGRTLLVD